MKKSPSSTVPTAGGTLSLPRLALRGLRYHRRTNLAVALAVMVASAVLTGALLVGDSMRGSLRSLLLDQLGQIDEVLVADRFFRSELAAELAAEKDFDRYFTAAVPAIYVEGTVDHPEHELRAGQVSVIGSTREFWKLGSGGPKQTPERGQIVLNEPLAAEIGAQVGDEVLLRIGSASQIPADSALGRKTETIRNRRLTVTEIIPAVGLGRLKLNPSQLVPLTAYVDPRTLAEALEQPGKSNAIFVAGIPQVDPVPAAHETLAALLRPQLADYGITVDTHKLGYVQLTSDRMLIDPAMVSVMRQKFSSGPRQEILTYLANTIALGDTQIPYSTITAMDFATQPPLGPFLDVAGKPIGPLADDEIVLNRWAADDLGARPGDEIEITYFEPESTHGKVREKSARFRLKDIVPLEGLAGDPDLTPQMPGITDQLSIGDWDPPFPFDSGRVRDKDEEYWDAHRTTPKAFISLAAGRKLWSSRFGDTTAVRVAPTEGAAITAETLSPVPAEQGLQFRPVKRLGLMAAAGTTAFDGLFVGFSLFIMVASLLLVALLFRLGIEQRAAEIGVLRTVGMTSRRIYWLLAGEGLLVASLGAMLGVALGVGYAWLMLVGLTTWWLEAISTPFLRLYITPLSLVIGLLGGLCVSLLTVLWSLRKLKQLSIRRLLAGQAQEDRFAGRASNRRGLIVAVVLLALAAACGLAGPLLRNEAQAGAFVGSGALVLAAALVLVSKGMRSGGAAMSLNAGSRPLTRLAARNGARNPGRSVMSMGLIAAASFLIVALSAFRLDPAALGTGLGSGSGGFALVAESNAPVYQNLNDAEGREELGFSSDDDELLARCDTVALRVETGDDASCLNLYQPMQPRVLGVTPALINRGGFDWGASLAETAEEQNNPWLLLDKNLPDEAGQPFFLPAVVDFNTATYSLKKGLGDVIEVTDGRGQPARLKIVGLLKNSIFQGDVLVGEASFLKLFPEVGGYRFFLVDTKSEPVDAVRGALEQSLGDYGFDAQSSHDRLAAFFAVQNTYLSTFQSLGGLGLLLGTFGLATVQLRSVLERRGELALMRAAGFRRGVLARLVMLENTLLLVGGLAIGVLAALVAVLPFWLGGGASVPWGSLAATLTLVLVVGLLAGLFAVRAVLRAELIPALRAE